MVARRTSSSHIPGPWAAVRVRPDGPFVIESHLYLLAETYGGIPRERERANARLMAAAPDLLEAAQALAIHPEFGYCVCLNRQQQQDGHTGECRDLRAAIARAEGREL